MTEQTCYSCEETIPSDANRCPYCGAYLKCPTCDLAVKKRWYICIKCATELRERPAPPAVPEQKPEPEPEPVPVPVPGPEHGLVSAPDPSPPVTGPPVPVPPGVLSPPPPPYSGGVEGTSLTPTPPPPPPPPPTTAPSGTAPPPPPLGLPPTYPTEFALVYSYPGTQGVYMSWEPSPSNQPISKYRVYRTRQFIATSDAQVLFAGQLAGMTWVDVPTEYTEVIDDTKSDQRYYIVVGVAPQGELVSVSNFLILPRMVAQPHNPFSLHSVIGGEKLGATLTARDEKRFQGAKKELEQAEWFKRTDQGQNRNRMLDSAFSAKVTLSMLHQFYPEHVEIGALAHRANELCTALQQEAAS